MIVQARYTRRIHAAMLAAVAAVLSFTATQHRKALEKARADANNAAGRKALEVENYRRDAHGLIFAINQNIKNAEANLNEAHAHAACVRVAVAQELEQMNGVTINVPY